MEGWTDFFTAQAGASSALLGLVFVSISLNLDKILALPALPSRALLALVVLLAVLTTALLLVLPGQSTIVMAAEVLAVGAVTGGMGATVAIKAWPDSKDHAIGFTINVLLIVLASVPYFVGGGYLIAGDLDGIYWVAAAMILSIIKATSDAWVLLVEIKR